MAPMAQSCSAGSRRPAAPNSPNWSTPSPSTLAVFLEREGLLERDAENSYLAGDAVDEGPMNELLGHSITYRIAVDPQQGRNVFTLQTLPPCLRSERSVCKHLGKVAGFSLHAGVAAKGYERKKLERLCRYISRPAVLEKRFSITSHGDIRYQLKTPCRDGNTHVIFKPQDFIARLAALVAKPRINPTRFHGVFAQWHIRGSRAARCTPRNPVRITSTGSMNHSGHVGTHTPSIDGHLLVCFHHQSHGPGPPMGSVKSCPAFQHIFPMTLSHVGRHTAFHAT